MKKNRRPMETRGWRKKACVLWAGAACLGSGISLAPLHAQETSPLFRMSKVFGGSKSETKIAIQSPDHAVALLNDKAATAATRMQIAGYLSCQPWQGNAKLESALIKILRSDANESVRLQTAEILSQARFLSANSYQALQTIMVGTDRDGYSSERSQAVKMQAATALQRHPVPASPARIAQMHADSARTRPTTTPPTVTLSFAPVASSPTSKHSGEEQSTPPESQLISIPGLAVPVAANGAAPCACQNSTVVETPAKAPASRWTLFAPKTKTTSSPAPILIQTQASVPVVVPSQPLSQPPNVIQPVSIPSGSTAPAMLPPSSQVNSEPANRSVLPPIVQPSGPLPTMKERRAGLRGEGLENASLRTFAEQVGAPPPSAAAPASTETPSLWRRMFGGGSSASTTPDRLPRSAESMGVVPISTNPPLRTP